MLENQKVRLAEYDGKYLNIGITEGGVPRSHGFVPWKHTASAFNMHTPDLWLAPEDLKDPVLMARLKSFRVLGCYIYVPLEDYSFLGEFVYLWDIWIQKGYALRSLSFMKDMKDWFMLYVEDATLEDLAPAFPDNWRKKGLHSYCVGFVGCKIGDISALVRQDIYLYELLVCQPEGTGEKDRWKDVRTGCYRYFEYKE